MRGEVFVLCFFFKQKTAYEMRISDWSSDVCSSDLADGRGQQPGGEVHFTPYADHARTARPAFLREDEGRRNGQDGDGGDAAVPGAGGDQPGRSDRKSGR